MRRFFSNRDDVCQNMSRLRSSRRLPSSECLSRSVAIVAHTPFIQSPSGMMPWADPNLACCAGMTFRSEGPIRGSESFQPGLLPVTRCPAPAPTAFGRSGYRVFFRSGAPRTQRAGQPEPLKPEFTKSKHPNRGLATLGSIFPMTFDQCGQSRGVRGIQRMRPDYPHTRRLSPDNPTLPAELRSLCVPPIVARLSGRKILFRYGGEPLLFGIAAGMFLENRTASKRGDPLFPGLPRCGPPGFQVAAWEATGGRCRVSPVRNRPGIWLHPEA